MSELYSCKRVIMTTNNAELSPGRDGRDRSFNMHETSYVRFFPPRSPPSSVLWREKKKVRIIFHRRTPPPVTTPLRRIYTLSSSSPLMRSWCKGGGGLEECQTALLCQYTFIYICAAVVSSIHSPTPSPQRLPRDLSKSEPASCLMYSFFIYFIFFLCTYILRIHE